MITYNPTEEVDRRPEKHVLIDADVVAYWGSAGTDDMQPRVAERKCDIRMNQILDECRAGNYTAYLTGADNFRDGIATLQRYKGNRYDKNGKRIKPQPVHLMRCKDYLVEEWNAIWAKNEEADDALSIHRSKYAPDDPNYIISTIDKDLLINYGYHHNMNTGKIQHVPVEIKPLEIIVKTSKTTGKTSNKVEGVGLMFFYAQMLMGDAADWIKGLPKVTDDMKECWSDMRRGGCGAMTATHVLKDCVSELQLHMNVWFCYYSYWMEHDYKHWDTGKVFKAGIETARKQFIEQGQLLWMRKREKELWQPKYPMEAI